MKNKVQNDTSLIANARLDQSIGAERSGTKIAWAGAERWAGVKKICGAWADTYWAGTEWWVGFLWRSRRSEKIKASGQIAMPIELTAC